MRNDMNRFSVNPVNLDISRSQFERNHSVKFSFNVGDVIPFYVDEVLPGDTFSVDTAKVVRLQPLVAPIMDNVYLDTYYFFVPNRIIWNHWKEFMGENTSSAWIPAVEYQVPQIKIPSGGFNVGTIADYLGIPPKVAANRSVNALPFRAYAAICNEWFRDQNNMNPVHITVDDTTITGSNGSDQTTDIEKGGAPFVAAKYHDYFTSCLPNAQKIAANQVQFALNGLLPVNAYKSKSNISLNDVIDDLDAIKFYRKTTSGGTSTATAFSEYQNQIITPNSSGNSIALGSTPSGQSTPVAYNLFADLNNTSVFDINELRNAFAIQKYYEKLARGGSRYTEFIKAFFGVDSPDGRQQRPEYLGGSRLTLNVQQVEQTSATESGLTPQGNLVGMSNTADSNSDFTKSFTEHGYILGVCVARYNHTYQQGVERHWLRKTKLDYYNPVFANLGEQAVLNTELYLAASDPDSVFGYQEAWADYRYKPSRVAGEMRSVYTTPLDSWHLADNYAAMPTLTDSWIREDKTMLDRCLAVTSSVSNQLIADFYIQCNCVRPMPVYSIPGLIDHH